MPEEVQIPGYNYSTPRQAAFDAIIGKLPSEWWYELPIKAKLLIVAVVVYLNPHKYLDADGYLTQSFSKVAKGIFGPEVNTSHWSADAKRMGLIERNEADRRVSIVYSEDVRSVLEDLGLYRKNPYALTPEQWELVHRKAREVCENPEVRHNGPLVAAIGYALLRQASACEP